MKKLCFTEQQIANAILDVQNGDTVEDVCQRKGISRTTFYIWKQKYEGMSDAQVAVARSLEEHNAGLRRQLSNELRDNRILKELVKEIGA